MQTFSPAKPEDASTIVLLQDRPSGLEVYLTKRQDSLPFLGGYHVFPGGKVDEEDCSSALIERCCGLSPEEAASRLEGVDDLGRACGFFVAGIRELFEEAGILLAKDGSGEFLEQPADSLSERLSSYRRKLQHDSLPFFRILEHEDLYLCLDRVLWFAQWITPATSPRRFNTYFFVARKPEGQSASPFSAEVSREYWVRPAEALERWKRGEWKMIPPTLASLETLSRYESWQQLKADFKRPPFQHRRTVWKGEM
ncbi:MAG: NUDIX hydrolase [bacterium]